MFWITVGQARRQTARAIGPSTIERSRVFAGMRNSTLQSASSASSRVPERVALPRIAAVEPALEPCLALLGGAVGELFRHHAAGAHLLQAIVANRGGGAQRLFEIAGIELDGAA